MNSKSVISRCITFITAIIMIFTVISTVSFVSPSAYAASNNSLTTNCSLNLRASDNNTSTVLTVLPSGAEVQLLSNSTNGWAKVSYLTYTGYCSTTYLNLSSGSAVSMTAKTTAEVNLRSGKGTSYTSLAFVPKSATVTVTDNSDDDWAYVTYSGKSGYINKPYLTVMFTLISDTTPGVPDTTYSTPQYTSLPNWFEYSYTNSILGDNNALSNKLVLSKSNIDLCVNDTYNLVVCSSGDAPYGKAITYKTSNPDVATVSKNGIITASSVGKATITATDLTTLSSAVCVVNVTANSTIVQPTAQPQTQKPTTAPTAPPTTPPTQAPTQPSTTATDTLSLSASSITMYYNNHYLLIAKSNSTVTWSTSNSSVATVSSSGMVISKGVGTATITARTATKTATCTVKVINATTTINVSHRDVNVPVGKTFLATSTVSSAKWTSSDTSVATVKDGYILGIKAGRAVVTASTSGGERTINVIVAPAEPVRFAYTSPNCAAKNSNVTLIALTDSLRTAVKFEVTVGSTTKTVNATSKTADGKNYIWKGTIKFDTAGTYKVVAYSKYNDSWSTCTDGNTTAFVTPTTDMVTTTCSKRRPSDQQINFIAQCEGYMSSVYIDSFTGDPTLGYGVLVYPGDTFYNSLSKTDAYAYLVQSVNNDGYSSKVNSFLINNNVKFNQQQYDALVSFVYNTGTGPLSTDNELISALLNCSATSSTGTSYYINGSAVRIRKGPGTTYDIIKELDYGTTLTIIKKTNSEWYYVQLADGTKGYVCTDYIASKTTSTNLDLNYVNKQNLINKFCQYHHAGGCVWGLLYRRVDEMEMFFYNDFERNYGDFKYPISFTCATNPSFRI